MNTTQWIHYFIGLFAICNPFGNLAIFITLTHQRSHRAQRQIAITTGFAVFVILLVTTWVGDHILKCFGISLAAFQLAGGTIITLIGLSLLRSEPNDMSHDEKQEQDAIKQESIAVVPMAIPMIAGPGAIATVMVNSHKFSGVMNKFYSSLAALLIGLIILLVFIFSGSLSRLLGASGIKIASKVMGLVLVAMAMQLITDALVLIFPGSATSVS